MIKNLFDFLQIFHILFEKIPIHIICLALFAQFFHFHHHALIHPPQIHEEENDDAQCYKGPIQHVCLLLVFLLFFLIQAN